MPASLLRSDTPDDRYRQLFEQNVAVQLMVDPSDGRIVDANPAAAAFYGFTREQLTARALTDLAALPADDVLQTLEVAAEVARHSYWLSASPRIRRVAAGGDLCRSRGNVRSRAGASHRA